MPSSGIGISAADPPGLTERVGRLGKRLLLSVTCGLLMLVAQASPLGQRVEHGWGLAGLYALRGPLAAPPGALIVALDDAGSEWLAFVAEEPGRASRRLDRCLGAEDRVRLGRVTDTLQLPRVVHACLIEALAERGADLVVFDIVFRAARENDERLASALAGGPPVILLEGIDNPAGTGTLRRERPAPAFASAAAATAFFRVVTDRTGLVLGFDTRLPAFPSLVSLPVAAEAVYRNRPRLRPSGSEPALEPLWHYGPARTVPTIPLRAVFDDATPPGRGLPEDLSGTVVFVGISDPGRAGETDHFRTVAPGRPSDMVAGVELAATAFLNRLHGERLQVLPAEAGSLLTFLAGALGAWSVLTAGGWRGAGRVATIAVVCVALSITAFLGFRAWVPVAVPVGLGLPLLALVGLAAGYRSTRTTLRQRLVRPVAEAVLDSDGRVPVGVREQEATVLFTDIVGSVALSDRLSTLGYSTVLTRFQSGAIAAVEAEGGIVVEIEGDGLLAVFAEEADGGPHARRACRAAQGVAKAAAEALPDGARMAVRPPVPAAALRLRMGLDTGPVMLGEIEAGGRFDYRAVGAVVNTAKRLEQSCRDVMPSSGSIALVSDAVRMDAMSDGALEFQAVGPRLLHGKERAIVIWRLRLSV